MPWDEIVKAVLRVTEFFNRKKKKPPKESTNLERKLQNIGLVDFHSRRLTDVDWNNWFEYMKKGNCSITCGHSLPLLQG